MTDAANYLNSIQCGPHGYYSAQNANVLPGPAALMMTLPIAAGPGLGAVIPGPAAGFVRFFDNAGALSPTTAVPLGVITPTLQPLNSRLTSAFGGNVVSLPLVPIVEGESYDVLNAGAVTGTLFVPYWDVPRGAMNVVRLTLSVAPQLAIPAPPAGFGNRIVPQLNFNASVGLGAITFSLGLRTINTDSVQHSVEFFQAGVLIGRADTSAGVLFTPVFPWRTVFTGAITVRTPEAVVTTAPPLVILYETVPLVPQVTP